MHPSPAHAAVNRQVFCVYGWINVRKMGRTTEVLQEDITVYINRIAEIVHTRASIHAGAPVRNDNDAFLLVWHLPTQETMSQVLLSRLPRTAVCGVCV